MRAILGPAAVWPVIDMPLVTKRRAPNAQRAWSNAAPAVWKGHGWDLETNHWRHPDRLSRLVLALALLYVWLVLWGAALTKAGRRAWVDRHNRRDLSLFRIGLDTLHRCFALEQAVPIPLPSLVASPGVRQLVLRSDLACPIRLAALVAQHKGTASLARLAVPLTNEPPGLRSPRQPRSRRAGCTATRRKWR
jgi:hypothetical protein